MGKSDSKDTVGNLKRIVKGSALLFTLSISAVIGIIILNFFLQYELSSKIVAGNYHRLKNIDNLQKADTLFIHSFYNEPLPIQSDSINLTVKKWGVFDVLCQQSVTGRDTLKRNILFGVKDSLPALQLSSVSKGIGMVGNSSITGDIKMQSSRIYPAFIGTNYFTGPYLHKGKILEPETSLTQGIFSEKVYQNWSDNIDSIVKIADTLFIDEILNQTEKKGYYYHSFTEETKWLPFEELSKINRGISLGGNIIIGSGTGVVIDSRLNLEDCLVVAPKVLISGTQEGSFQVFASDSIVLESGVHLKYPSGLVLMPKLFGIAQSSGKIIINENVSFEGYIRCEGVASEVSFLDNCKMKGIVDVEGLVSPRGEFEGCISARSLIYRTPSGVYENILYNTKIQSAYTYSIYQNQSHGEIRYLQVLQ